MFSSPVERIRSTVSSAVTRKSKKIVPFTDRIKKNVLKGQFNSFIKKGEVSIKGIPGAKARQLNHHILPLIEDTAAIHVGVNDLFSNY